MVEGYVTIDTPDGTHIQVPIGSRIVIDYPDDSTGKTVNTSDSVRDSILSLPVIIMKQNKGKIKGKAINICRQI